MKNLAIIVPYRDREENKKIFIPYLNEYLRNKNLRFDIFIIEQGDTKPFNRGKLLNVGYSFSSKLEEYESFVMHDVDMLPVNVDYSTPTIPTHLASRVEQFNWGIPYQLYFGGITSFPSKVFEKVNGYSNRYWGWGCEDDDMFYRIQYNGIDWSRREGGMVRSLNHTPQADQEEHSKKNSDLMQEAWLKKLDHKQEGLNTLEYEPTSYAHDGDHYLVSVNL